MNTLNHPLYGQVNYSATSMPGAPDGQVEQAISQMSRYAIDDSRTPAVMADAQSATSAAGGDPVKGAWQQARKRIRFVEDRNIIDSSNVVEVLIRPVDVCLLAGTSDTGMVVGDCDDFSMYVASLLLAQNIPCCFATVAADDTQPDVYSHVYVVAYPQTGRVAIDASHGKFCGWEAPNRYGKLREWDLFEASRLRGNQASSVLMLLAIGAFAWWYIDRYGFSLPEFPSFGGLIGD